MKKKFLKIGAVILLTATVSSLYLLSVTSHSEGSDPLITLSYLTEIILPQFKTDVISEVDKKLNIGSEEQISDGTVNNSESNVTDIADEELTDTTITENTAQTPDSAKASSYTLLELTYGQCVYANSVLEIIVRPGSEVLAISPFAEQGIADITGTKEYLNGDILDINSYCIIPRGNDGRGIYVNNEKSYILVRGEYYIG